MLSNGSVERLVSLTWQIRAVNVNGLPVLTKETKAAKFGSFAQERRV